MRLIINSTKSLCFVGKLQYFLSYTQLHLKQLLQLYSHISLDISSFSHSYAKPKFSIILPNLANLYPLFTPHPAPPPQPHPIILHQYPLEVVKQDRT